ncbi:MAG: hypothetical protein AAGF97_06490, partial [Planctomycetota bacterium]
RLIVPVARFAEFEETVGGILPREAAQAWRISALLPPADSPTTRDLSGAFREIEDFNLRHASAELGFAHIDTAEVRCSCLDSINGLAKLSPAGMITFVELAVNDNLESHLTCVAQHRERLHAKIRTGGITEDLIPPAESVARFVKTCVDVGLPFKATAGLHHPVRARQALTYERNPDEAMMHGFLNLLMATGGLLLGKLPLAEATTLLREVDPATIVVDEQTGWHWEELTLDLNDVTQLRQRGMLSFGSCSFIEPVEDLQALGHTLSLTSSR